jgi:allophanate hydrolase
MKNPDLAVLSFDSLHHLYVSGQLTAGALITSLNERIAAVDRPEIWISRVPPAVLVEQAALLDVALQQHGAQVLQHLPLFGLPFAVKDNIDVAGMATTAACPDFAYDASSSATVVRKLQDAGAILIGKTNLDQFATGLVGTRSPYGAVRNAIDPSYVSGGSSSGSAVAVALKLVSFSLGTDTAGSGRIPAGFNGIVGFKPTRGLLSAQGVVPACRTLDCVAVFAQNVADAWHVLQACAGFDADDAYSRQIEQASPKVRGYRIGVPQVLEFFGDAQAENAFSAALAQVTLLPATQVEPMPFGPFVEAAAMLYQGPWVAERRAAIGDFFDAQPEAMNVMDSTVRKVVAQADRFSAVDVFNGSYRLAQLKRDAEMLMEGIDFLIVPTAPTMPTLAAVAAEPVLRNSELGYYTNFVNFFDMAALALPGLARKDGLPAGITLIGRCGSDHLLAAAGAAIEAAIEAATEAALAQSAQTIPTEVVKQQRNLAADPLPFAEPTIRVAVVGAHLEGQPLNWQLIERGARKLQVTITSASYRLFALPDTTPPKPGLAFVKQGGVAIAVEVWEMPLRHFGSFVAAIAAPLGIGTLQLGSGQAVHGFICEAWAIEGARDISSFGGWRAYLDAGASSVG